MRNLLFFLNGSFGPSAVRIRDVQPRIKIFDPYSEKNCSAMFSN
jgi:hypothetical protein